MPCEAAARPKLKIRDIYYFSPYLQVLPGHRATDSCFGVENTESRIPADCWCTWKKVANQRGNFSCVSAQLFFCSCSRGSTKPNPGRRRLVHWRWGWVKLGGEGQGVNPRFFFGKAPHRQPSPRSQPGLGPTEHPQGGSPGLAVPPPLALTSGRGPPRRPFPGARRGRDTGSLCHPPATAP